MKERFKKSVKDGFMRGWFGYLWLLKILIPISFATVLLIYSGWLYKLDFLIQPLMGILYLPASAALPIIIGLFTGIYGAVAAMATMPLTQDQMTLIAIFLLISHNLPMESTVQGQSGLNPWLASIFRLVTSLMVTWVCAQILKIELPAIAGAALDGTACQGIAFSSMLTDWMQDTAGLCFQIFCIIIPLMTAMELMKEFDLIQHLVKVMFPVLSLMGLNRKTGILWLTAACFGLAYGAAFIVEETKNNTYSREELTRLHISIGINHAMIEDPALFLPLGILPLWLWIPRLIAAIAAIYLFNILNLVRRLHAERTGHKKLCNNR